MKRARVNNFNKWSGWWQKQAKQTGSRSRTVVLKVGGSRPLGPILRGKGAKKTKREIGGKKQHKGSENAEQLIHRSVDFSILLLWLVSFLQLLICYDNCWRFFLKQLPVQFLLWIVYARGCSVDYFHKNSECDINVLKQFLSSTT